VEEVVLGVRIDWVTLVSDKLLSKGLSIKTDISILSKDENKISFNTILRDLVEEFPNKRMQHILLSLRDHYDIIELFELLDEQNKFILEKHYFEEDGLLKNGTKKKSNRKK
jgi:hypothetical protein